LLKPGSHINILDSFGDKGFELLFKKYKKEYEEWRRLLKVLASLGGDEHERGRQIDIYQFQVKEIDSANLSIEEEESLVEKKNKMQSYEKITEALNHASGYLGGEEGGLSLVRRSLGYLSGVSGLDERLGGLYEELETIKYSLDEVSGGLSDYLDEMEFDEDEFARVDTRIDEIKILKRKYGGTVEQVLSFLSETQMKLDKLLNSDKEVEKTKKEIEAQLGILYDLAKDLSGKRKEVAAKFEVDLLKEIRELGMSAATFSVSFKNLSGQVGSLGTDDIEFLFSANAGEPLMPLSSVASGGELSRFMLALKTILSGKNQIGTMIFDEIDTGIGGVVATQVAKKIAVLAKSSQILAVTHLPQIAAAGDSHFYIKKGEENERTRTTVTLLDEVGSLEELARMIGGVGEEALGYAKSLRSAVRG